MTTQTMTIRDLFDRCKESRGIRDDDQHPDYYWGPAMLDFERFLGRPGTIDDFTKETLDNFVGWLMERYSKPFRKMADSRRRAILVLCRFAVEEGLLDERPRVRHVIGGFRTFVPPKLHVVVYMPIRELFSKFEASRPKPLATNAKERHFKPAIQAFESFLGRSATCQDLTRETFGKFTDWAWDRYGKEKAEPKRRAIHALQTFALHQGRTPEVKEFIPINHVKGGLYMVRTRMRTGDDPTPDQCFCRQLRILARRSIKEALLWIDPKEWRDLIEDNPDNTVFMFEVMAADPEHQAAFEPGIGFHAKDELTMWKKALPWFAKNGVERARLVAVGADDVKLWAIKRAIAKA
jgi:hypothetical protein